MNIYTFVTTPSPYESRLPLLTASATPHGYTVIPIRISDTGDRRTNLAMKASAIHKAYRSHGLGLYLDAKAIIRRPIPPPPPTSPRTVATMGYNGMGDFPSGTVWLLGDDLHEFLGLWSHWSHQYAHDWYCDQLALRMALSVAADHRLLPEGFSTCVNTPEDARAAYIAHVRRASWMPADSPHMEDMKLGHQGRDKRTQTVVDRKSYDPPAQPPFPTSARWQLAQPMATAAWLGGQPPVDPPAQPPPLYPK